MPIFYKNASTTDDQRNVYVVGSTNNGSSGNDILIQKFNKFGDLLWEQSFNGGANAEDIGADVFVDASYNVYVTGGATQTTQNNLDLVVLKYNSIGVLQWSYFYNFGGSPIPYDGGTAITGDNNGSIYVTGTSAGTNTLTDFVTIRLNANNGNQLWTTRYDFAQLNEVPSKIRVSGSSIIVTGASQSTQTPNIKWELATIRYNSSNGNQVGLSRTGGNSSSGIDEANDLSIDNNGNVYVVGATNNLNTGYDITILKFNDDLQLLWQQTFNGYSGEDKGYGIKTDAQGNVYAVGYVTNPNQGKNYSILKYNSAGTLQWSREFNGLANQDDEAVQLVVRGDRIFVTGAARNSAYSDIVTMGYTADGQIFSVKSFESQFGLNDKPTAMGIDLDENLIVVGQMQDTMGNYRNVTFKYSVYEKPIIPVYIDSVPVYNQNELIVRFDKSAMNFDAVDKKNFDAGLLKNFVHEYVIDSLNAKFPFDAGRLPTFKIFRRMTTADSLSITRLGDTIPVPAFWATLSVMFPEEYDLFEAIDSLNTMKPMVHYGEVNGFGFLASTPNDVNYHSGLNSPSHGINIELAWELGAVGKEYTKAGVYDNGIRWNHVEFQGMTFGNNASFEDSKIAGGKDYTILNGGSPSNYVFLLGDSGSFVHGTAVASVLGGIRNNYSCTAGVAGGDFDNDPEQRGCSLYDMRLKTSLPPEDIVPILYSQAAEAIVEGAINSPNTGYGFGLHIQNHSWGSVLPSVTLKKAVNVAFVNNSMLVCASGNIGQNNQVAVSILYPASYDENWIMKVGANDQSGATAGFSIHGSDLDFIAPGSQDVYTAAHAYGNGSQCDHNAPGTSFATPHVAGTAAIMHGQHNLLNNEQNYPNDITHEDVENVLKKTATDQVGNFPYQVGWDVISGYGRINAGLAVLNITLPYYYVLHSNEAVDKTTTLDATDVNMLIQDNIYDLSSGNYVADRYLVEQDFEMTIPIEHTVVDHWDRPSSTDGFNNSTNQFCAPWLSYTYNETEQGAERLITVTTSSYCYHITDDGNGNPMDLWLPVHPDDARAAFSLHVKTNISLSVEENDEFADVTLYPNPNNSQQLFITGLGDAPSQIEFINLTGQKVMQVNSADASQHIDISNLEAGFYVCRIMYGNQMVIRNFVKL